MRHFSIKEVENFCSIRAATLRIWEKRYRLSKPGRNDGGRRQYSLTELEFLLHAALLNRNGYKISKIAEVSLNSLRSKAASLTHIDDRLQHAVNLLIVYKFSADTEGFEQHLDACFSRFGINQTLQKVIVPFLEKANLLSYSSTANEVHLAVTLIRKKILYYIEILQPDVVLNKTALLFLPEGEHFDLMLLYMCYFIKATGLKPIYLGTNIGEQNVLAMLRQKKPDYLYTYLPPKKLLKMQKVLSFLQETSPQTKINVIGSAEGESASHQPGVNYIHYNHLQEALTKAQA